MRLARGVIFARVKRRLIGRSDIADFPQLGLERIAVKVDTGAYTSSIHCHHIRVEPRGRDGREVLTFKLLDPSHPDYDGRVFAFEQFRSKRVRSSNGSAERRYVIASTIRLFARTYPLELTLSERQEMRFPVLLGRRLLHRRFVVDVAETDLSYAHERGS